MIDTYKTLLSGVEIWDVPRYLQKNQLGAKVSHYYILLEYVFNTSYLSRS